MSDEQRDAQPIDENDQPAEPDANPPAEDPPPEQSANAPADAQPAEESEVSPAADTVQSAEQSDVAPAGASDQAAPQSGDGSGTQSDDPYAGGQGSGDLSAGRQEMLALIDKWMPTSLSYPRIPDGETQDLLARAGWTKATGQSSKAVKDGGGHPTTSCGDILGTLLRLWRSNFVGAFNIRDTDATGRGPGAKQLGYYVDADQLVMDGDTVTSPKPGDIIVLRNGFGSTSAGSVGHVGILVEAGKTKWRTADGGGGQLPDQTANVTERDVRWIDNTPILKSPTDLKEKQLDGWVDLDKLQQTG
jgi:hypothetical protein